MIMKFTIVADDFNRIQGTAIGRAVEQLPAQFWKQRIRQDCVDHLAPLSVR
jgi:hypothetical protein